MAMTDDSRNNPNPSRTVRLLWDEPEGPARGPRRGHDTAQIVAAAVGLADTRGTGALSMRQVAAAVGCGTMTLYTYVSGKAELLELMTDHVYGEITPPARDEDWEESLRSLAEQHFHLCLKHPWILEGNLVRLSLGPNFISAREHAYAALERCGLSPEDTMAAARALDDYVHGAARSALLETEATAAAGTDSAGLRLAREEFWDRWFDLDRFPVHTRLWTFGAFSAEHSARASFSFGLDCLLGGIRARQQAAG